MTRLSHNAFVYDSDDQYVEGALSHLREGSGSGDALIVASTRDRLGVVREALGDDARRVRMIDVGSLYAHPARTIGSYYRALVEQLRLVPRVRLVAQVVYGPTPEEWARWTAYEAIFTRVFSALPALVVCTYDARETPDAVTENVWRTHPEVLTDEWRHSESCEEPEDTVRRLTPPPRALRLQPLAAATGLSSFREAVAAALADELVPARRRLDALLAASELAANAIEHGGGIEEARFGTVDGRFVCEVTDPGPGFEDPIAGYMPPQPGQETGKGLWIVRQLAAQLEFFGGEGGFTARIWI